MAKKQITNYKFFPGVIPPNYGEYPTAVASILANKNYIIEEAMGFLQEAHATPGSAPTAYPGAITLLTNNKSFIVEEANAWVLHQISTNTSPFVSYPYNATVQTKCKRDIGYLVDAWITDLTGGGNANTIRIARTYHRNGVAQLLSPTQEAAVYAFLKTLINSNVLTITPWATLQSPVISAQNITGPAGEAGAITRFNTLIDIVTSVIPNGLASLPAKVSNFNETFVGYTYDESKCRRDVKYVLDSYLYDLTYGGNSSTYYTASRYYINNVIQINNPAVEVQSQSFIKLLIKNYILTNTLFPSYQTIVQQSTLASIEPTAGSTLETLANIVINVIESGLSTLPSPVAPNSQQGGLMPSTISLIEQNKRFIQEEAIAYIQYNVNNNISPYIFYTYNAEKCRRDISYILEGYIRDLKNGGNSQTYFNASRYWVNGVAQVDGDRNPEIFAHTFIRNLIENFILTNIHFSARQSLVSQVTNNLIIAEPFANTKITELSNIVLDVIANGSAYLPTKISNKGYLKIPGYYKLKDFLLITNSSRNQIMYNFADSTVSAEVTYSENNDTDFPSALYGVDKITTLTFDSETSNMMVTDNIQIFVEGKEQEVKMNRSAQDAMERLKVGIPQSMLDADFEYGLQPTKWQAIGTMRNYPSIYEIPNAEIPVTNVVTDASSGTSGTGASLITVTTQNIHGLSSGDSFTIKALSNSVLGFSRAEGSFLINSVPTPTTFTYYAKSKVGTAPGQVLASSYTQLRKGSFYTNSAIGNTSFSVYSAGSSGNITTVLITPAGRDVIGFIGDPPPIGAPLSGTGIASGAQVTAVAGSGGGAISTQLITSATTGATDIIVTDTAGIGPGLIFNRGDGLGVSVTNVVGNTISLSSGLTSAITGTSESYSNRVQSSTSGAGTGAIFTVSRNDTIYSASIDTAGNSYVAGNSITILGTSLGGASPLNDATITVTSASPINSVLSFDNTTLISGSGYFTSGSVDTTSATGTGLTVSVTAIGAYGIVGSVNVSNGGSGYAVNDIVTINNVTGRALEISYPGLNGSGYTSGIYNVTGGTGSDITVNIVARSTGEVVNATLTSPGTSGYVSGIANTSAVSGSGSGLTFSITANASGVITELSVQTGGFNYAVGNVVTILGGSGNATATVQNVTNGEVTNIVLINRGTGYSVNDTVTITGGGNNASFTITNVSSSASIRVASISPGGAIQSISTAGTPIVAPSKDFYSALTISENTTAQIASGNTGITYSAVATIQVTFSTAHGFIPGDTITVAISSTGVGAQLAAGPFFVEQAPADNVIRYTARAAGSIDNNLVGTIYGRPDSFFIHRPFDGGVMLGTGGPSHGAQAIRMSKKYIRYQSGKGVMYNTGALFAPSYDIRSLTSTGTAIGSIITLITDDVDHGCQVGGVITINGAITSGYNGTYTVIDITTERQLSVVANKVLGGTTAQLGNPCQMAIRNWHGATIRSGIFDDQNGMFWQYDGIRMAVVRRSSTFQIAGSIAIAANSNLVTGTNTRFTTQLAAGDRVVIRGMSHVVSEITNDTQMFVTPDFRGVKDIGEAKIVKTIDLIVPQEEWNLDPLNGSGPSGYNFDVTKMQMIGIQHTWYGAGFIDFMLRGPDGNYVWAHRFRNSNVNTEAYMRTGNQPVRYEVINEGAKDKLSESIDGAHTTIPLTNAYWFPTSGTVIIDSELIRYTGNTGTALTGCTRGANITQFTAGSQRTFSGSAATSHSVNAGVILVSNTITPSISHWGSAFMIDGQFDSDRGYIFNYAATAVQASTEKNTAFLIRLAPSVSNAQTGDLGEKELLNRAQLLLSSIAITSDGTTGGATPSTITGGIVIEGVLNPSNYPTDPTKITWTGLQTAAQGGQPSFAQVAAGGSVSWGAAVVTTQATVQGAFTTTLTAKSFNSVSTNLTATSFSAVNQTITLRYFTGRSTALSSSSSEVYITTADYDALQTSMFVGDTLSGASSGSFKTATTISQINRDYRNEGGTSYTRIVMNQAAQNNSSSFTNVTCTLGSVLATRYNTAISTARNDFLIPNAQASNVALADVLSVATFITGGQTVSSVTSSYCKISNITYARIAMTSNGNSTSTVGSGNNITVTSTLSATATYNRAFSTTRSDFLVTDAQYLASGIQTSDVLSAGLNVNGSQIISSIVTGYVSISGVSYTRIIMSSNANTNSSAGGGNDITVTVTAAGTSASYANKNYLFFTSTSWLTSGATYGTKVDTTVTQFPAGTAVTAISTRTFGATTVYRATFNQTATTTINAAESITFAFGANYALPGEQVFSFIANPGDTSELNLGDLKELTSTALGGRGTFPNGPDVLAINIYKVSGTATPCNIILRWGEAQA